MKALPESIQNKVAQSLSIVTKKGTEKKTLLIGLALCLFLGSLLYLVNRETKSIHAHLEGARVLVSSPIEGTVWDLPLKEGSNIRKGEPLLRFDPAYIRQQNASIREYLSFFQANRHNTGTLKQKFRPIFSHIFDELSINYRELVKVETEIKHQFQDANSAHISLQLQMRDPHNKGADGLPNPELVAKEEEAAAHLKILQKNLEDASKARADMDAKISKVTADLNKPHGMLYRFLEEQNEHVQNLIRHEYLYAANNGTLGEVFVKLGDIVEKGTPLYEVLPENSGQLWVNATFTNEDAKDLKDRQLCTVIADNGLEFDARIISITEDRENNNTNVRLFVQNAPEELTQKQSLFLDEKKPEEMPIFVTVIAK